MLHDFYRLAVSDLFLKQAEISSCLRGNESPDCFALAWRTCKQKGPNSSKLNIKRGEIHDLVVIDYTQGLVQLLLLIFTSMIFEFPKCDVNPQPNTRDMGPLVGWTSRYHRSVTHILAVILSVTCHFFFISQNIFIRVIWSGRKICRLLTDLSIFLQCSRIFKIFHSPTGE